MVWAGEPLSADGVAALYRGVIDGLVADETAVSVPVLETGTLMADAATRRRLAQEALEFALGLTSAPRGAQ